MHDWVLIVCLTLMAGLAMPLGALIASFARFRSEWLDSEFRHSVIAFGGGALMSAVALVLVPEGIKKLSLVQAAICFSSGGVAFMLLDIRLNAMKGSFSQLVAMLTDFIPEALALGATLALGGSAGLLLAGLMALQNLPEGFNAYKELERYSHYGRWKIVGAFTVMALLGPAAGMAGYGLSAYPVLISAVMLFAGGGILYLVFQDIAPQAHLEKRWGPPLGAVCGFLLGIIGQMVLNS